jgi:uncharacterized protein YjiS (DUF1127 family)
MTWFSRIFLRRENRKTAEELYKLPDRQLEDIGLTRGDIDKLIKDEY